MSETSPFVIIERLKAQLAEREYAYGILVHDRNEWAKELSDATCRAYDAEKNASELASKLASVESDLLGLVVELEILTEDWTAKGEPVPVAAIEAILQRREA